MKKTIISSLMFMALISSYNITYSDRTNLTAESESEINVKDLQQKINNIKKAMEGKSYSANKINSLHLSLNEALEALDSARDKQDIMKKLDKLHNSLNESNIKTSKLLVVKEKIAKLEKRV